METFRIVKDLSELKLNKMAIERAVDSFVKDSHTEETGADPDGLYNQTIEGIALATIFSHDNSRHFWIAEENGEVMAYALTHVAKEVDNKLCFWMTQAWVHKSLRGKQEVKKMYERLKEEASRLMCKHIVIPSSRETKSYCRFLGKEWHPYVTLLKTDL